MSTSQPTPAAATPPKLAFETWVWRRRDVCNRCFRVMGERDHPGTFEGVSVEDHDPHSVRPVADDVPDDAEPTWHVPDAGHEGTVAPPTIGHEPTDTYGEIVSTSTERYCAGCGSERGGGPGADDLSRREALAACDRMLNRLREVGLNPDAEAARALVRAQKSDPEQQGKDREVFTAAAWYALD